MANAIPFEVKDVDHGFRISLVRRSTDGMFTTNEDWLCAFSKADCELDAPQIDELMKAVAAANVNHFLFVVFGPSSQAMDIRLRRTLRTADVRVALIKDELARVLARDYSHLREFISKADDTRFSFAALRSKIQSQFDSAPWKKRYQSPTIQPRVLPLHSWEAAVAESDLFGAVAEGSLLLLGEPGGGKTTAMRAIGHALAVIGPYTPVYVPLRRYEGDFWNILCQALQGNGATVPKATAEKLIGSGILALLLDGLNEVQDVHLRRKLVNELNAFEQAKTVGGEQHLDFVKSHIRL